MESEDLTKWGSEFHSLAALTPKDLVILDVVWVGIIKFLVLLEEENFRLGGLMRFYDFAKEHKGAKIKVFSQRATKNGICHVWDMIKFSNRMYKTKAGIKAEVQLISCITRTIWEHNISI